jgi:hypothetical protein
MPKNRALFPYGLRKASSLIPLVLLLAMVAAVLLADALFPLPSLLFSNALIVQLAPWTLWPNQLLFPHPAVSPFHTLSSREARHLALVVSAWQECILFFVVILLVCILYLLALTLLPSYRVRYRYLIGSTLMLGMLYALIPVVTSQDVFLYISYARMLAIYHLNPLTTPPTAIAADPIYAHIFWIHQPSIYGPTWILLLAALQWLLRLCSCTTLPPFILLLRMVGLSTHMGSTQMLWLLTGQLQQDAVLSTRQRVAAVLAFAWNPLLLMEAVVNIHCDTFMLFIVLLALWLLVARGGMAHPAPISLYACSGIAVLLAMATGIKFNIALFLPGLLLFLWWQPQRLRKSIVFVGLYLGVLVLLYAPFWQQGAPLKSLQVNPSSTRMVNTLAEFFSQLAKSLAHLLGSTPVRLVTIAAEPVTRDLSLLLFVGAYVLLCWKVRAQLHTPLQLVRWMALAWLLYCALGSPWFWPWYMVTFFGLAICVAFVPLEEPQIFPPFGTICSPLALSLLSFSMLSIYGFFSWAPSISFFPWLPGWHWAYMRGLWTWLLPVLVLYAGIAYRKRLKFYA